MRSDPARLLWGACWPPAREFKKCTQTPVFWLVLSYQKTSLNLLLWGLLCAACGSENDRPPPAPAGSEVPDLTSYDSRTGDSRDIWAEGGCEAGSTQECRVYLPAHDGIQPCFVGVQKCVDGNWGLCDEAELVDANSGDSSLDPSTPPPAP